MNPTVDNPQLAVADFHSHFIAEAHDTPQFPSDATKALRKELIYEEFTEFSLAQEHGNLVEVADALGDLLYVVYGAAVSYGIDMEPIFEEIHRSNMTKLWTESEYQQIKVKGDFYELYKDYDFAVVDKEAERQYLVLSPTGKVIKSPSYEPAKIKEILLSQSAKDGNCTVIINAVEKVVREGITTYEQIVGLAGYKPGSTPTVAYHGTRGCEGCLFPGYCMYVSEGMVINAVYTGNA